MSINLLTNQSLDFLHKIDWEKIVSPICNDCHFDKSAAHIKLPPGQHTREEINFQLNSTEDFVNLLSHDFELITNELRIFPKSSEYSFLFKKIEKENLMTIQELNFICLSIEKTFKIQQSNKSWAIFHSFSTHSSDLSQVRSKFCRPFRSFISETCDIDYYKHPELGKLFTQLNDLEKHLRDKITAISKSDFYKDAIQFHGFDIIFDRYVIPLRSDCYKSDFGPIIAKSNSGMTIYVEPFELKDQATKRIKILAEIEYRIQIITQEFSESLHPFCSCLKYCLDKIFEVDLLNAKARYCINNQLVRPVISSDSSIILENFYHPLIKNAVKNSFTITNEGRGIIISGPNTGGKTVLLKSVGIIHLFLHLGLFSPATFAQIPFFDSIFYMGSDNQDLSTGLSSFSAEVTNYFNLLTNLAPSNLIIIDEIFNSTASEEASALALAFLEELSFKNMVCKIFVSTHHNLLKGHLYDSKEFISAHMGFDDIKKTPTFKLFLGSPGASMAIEIFESLVKGHFLDLSHMAFKAKEILGEKYIVYERQLSEIQNKNSSLDKLINENTKLNIELKNQKSSSEGLLFLERQNLIGELKKKLGTILNKADGLLEKVKDKTITTQSKLSKEFSTINSEINSLNNLLSPQEEYLPSHFLPDEDQPLIVGNRYFSTLLNKQVTLLSIDKKNMATVATPKINIKCSQDTLKILKNNQVPKKQPSQLKYFDHIEWETKDKTEYDCRGMRLDEFNTLVESALLELLAGKIPYLKLIHGHGEGVLKNWLRTYLKKHDEFKWQSESNDGASLITLTS